MQNKPKTLWILQLAVPNLPLKQATYGNRSNSRPDRCTGPSIILDTGTLALTASPVPIVVGAASLTTGELSGADWVQRFPTSSSTGDLAPGFRSSVESFVAALRAAGASVTVSATLRPPERAYLMHWSWRIAQEDYDPREVPSRSNVNINWIHTDASGHYDERASRRAAQDMVSGYSIQFRPSLNSRHTEGKAIDMTISWSGDLSIADASGTVIKIDAPPRNGGNTRLHAVGATYGVIKLVADPPHWSDDGH
jgi:hypothetical protein